MTERCPICDWPMAERREDGCVPGDCSYRPEQGSPEWHRIRQRRAEIENDEKVRQRERSDLID